MGRMYGAILGEIERPDYDVFRKRAAVPPSRKLAIILACGAATAGEGARGSLFEDEAPDRPLG